VTLDDIKRDWARVEAVVDATPGIDPWCSGPDWQLAVHQGFAPDADLLLLATDATPEPPPTPGPGPAAPRSPDGYALLAHYVAAEGLMLAGLEPLWGFGSPLLGPDPARTATALAHHLDGLDSWQALVLPGLPPLGPQGADCPEPDDDRSPTLAVGRALTGLGAVGVGEGITRQIIDLHQGYDAWFERRSAKFRRNLRRAWSAAADHGLDVVDVSAEPDVFPRLLAIETGSWKGRELSGVVAPDMMVMYRTLTARLQERGRLRAHVARLGGRDVGYILGGLRNRRYRGLQLSYCADVAGLSIGNLLQAHQLQLLARTGEADVYDLGMDIEYKRRWADRAEHSATLMVQRGVSAP
jgi:hypothetical protein